VRTRRLLAVVGLLFAATTGTSCGTVDCSSSKIGDSGVFVGRLTSVHGDNATFSVESWTPARGGALVSPAPVVGSTVVVEYVSNEIRFLHVGRRYAVSVFDGDHGLGSGVHTANSCSGGTVNANGSSIDTSLVSRPIVKRALRAFVLVIVLMLVLLAWITRRSHRARSVTTVSSEDAE